MKQALCLLIAAALLLSLSGCAGSVARSLGWIPAPSSAASPSRPPLEEEPAGESPADEPAPENPEEEAAGEPGQVGLTRENYQDFFLPVPGYDHIAVAYYLVSPQLYGGQAEFAEAYLPYDGGEPVYLEGGCVVQSQAHGMRVTETLTASEGTAAQVVDAQYDALCLEEAPDFYEDGGVGETHLDSQYGVATRRLMYFVEDRTKVRVTVLYADPKGDGVYLSARIDYLTELLDDEYPALLEELRDVFALNLPEIPPFDVSSTP